MPVPTLPPVKEGQPRDQYYAVEEAQGSTPAMYVNSSVGVTDTGKVFIFGGFDKYEDEMDNNVKILDLTTKTWSKRAAHRLHNRTTAGQAPAARSGHTAVMRKSTAVVFGGEQENGVLSNEVFYYDVEQDQWSTPEIANGDDLDMAPQGRSRHAACLSDDGTKMIISGGVREGKVLNDMYWFDFYQRQWHGPLEFVRRYDHTIACYNNKIWAFGGLTPDMDRISEVAWYDFDTNTIGKVQIRSLDYPLVGSSGTHFYGSGVGGTMLDVVVPGSIPDVSTSVASLDMDSLSWRSIVEDCSEYFSGYSWFHMVAFDTKLVLLGQPVELNGYDEKLSHILTIDLSEFGYLNSKSRPSSNQSSSLGAGTIGHDMWQFYKQSQMCDFEITAVRGQERPDEGVGFSDMEVCEPIKVHMMVLAARWPHFQRIIASGMSETQSKRLFIPEPQHWVAKLVEYMYRDSIDGANMDVVTGLLILANLYELPRLRKLCLEFVSREGMNADTAVMIWERAMVADEHIIRRNAALYCLRHWGVIVRTARFQSLSKQNLLLLCHETDERSLITTTRNSPHLYAHGGDDDDEEEEEEEEEEEDKMMHDEDE